MNQWNNFLGVLLTLILLSLSGCAGSLLGGYGPNNNMSREEFEKYVESVFRLQNSMTSEVMMLGDSDETLLKAEHDMRETCSALNEYASRDSEGLSVGFFLGRQVEKSALDCEKAANKVKAMLEKH